MNFVFQQMWKISCVATISFSKDLFSMELLIWQYDRSYFEKLLLNTVVQTESCHSNCLQFLSTNETLSQCKDWNFQMQTNMIEELLRYTETGNKFYVQREHYTLLYASTVSHIEISQSDYQVPQFALWPYYTGIIRHLFQWL